MAIGRPRNGRPAKRLSDKKLQKLAEKNNQRKADREEELQGEVPEAEQEIKEAEKPEITTPDPNLKTEKMEFNNKSFEENSPLLSEDVIQRPDEIPLSAAPKEEPKKFGKFNAPRVEEAKIVDQQAQQPLAAEATKPPVETFTPNQGPAASEPLRRMEISGEQTPPPMDPAAPSMSGVQQQIGQTTAKYAWTVYENFSPKIFSYLTEYDISLIERLVAENKLDKLFLEYAKDHNDSLEKDFKVQDYEREMVLIPLEEVLAEKGMNSVMSPGARLAIGIALVGFMKFKETMKHRKERDDKFQTVLKMYKQSKGPESDIPLMETEEVFPGELKKA